MAQAKCRSGAAGPAEPLPSASLGEFIRGEGSFWMQVLREEPETKCRQTKPLPRVLLCWGFFLDRGRLGSFVCLFMVCFFPSLFYAYLLNHHNCNYCIDIVLNYLFFSYRLCTGKVKGSKGAKYGRKCFSQEQFCGIRTNASVYIIGDI